MQSLKEMKLNSFPVNEVTSKVKCKIFEDNSGALEMATNHSYRPRTKHLNLNYITLETMSLEEKLVSIKMEQPINLQITQQNR